MMKNNVKITGINYDKMALANCSDYKKEYLKKKMIEAYMKRVPEVIQACHLKNLTFNLYLSTIPEAAEHMAQAWDGSEYSIFTASNPEKETGYILYYFCSLEKTDYWNLIRMNENEIALYNHNTGKYEKKVFPEEYYNSIMECMSDTMENFVWVQVFHELHELLVEYRCIKGDIEDVFRYYEKYRSLLELYYGLRKKCQLTIIKYEDDDGVVGYHPAIISKDQMERHYGITQIGQSIEMCYLSMRDDFKSAYTRTGSFSPGIDPSAAIKLMELLTENNPNKIVEIVNDLKGEVRYSSMDFEEEYEEQFAA